MNQPLHQFLLANIIAGSPDTTPDIGLLGDAGIVDPSITADTSSPPPGLIGDLVFDGSGGISLSDAGMPTEQSPWTFCGWLKTAEVQDSYFDYWGLFAWGDVNSTDWTWAKSYALETLRIYFGNEGESVYGNTNVCDTNWHHFAFVYTGSQILIYVDGALDGASNFDPSITTAPLLPLDIALTGTMYLGSDGFGNNFDGSLADMRVYGYALSAGEISAIYNAQNTDPGDVWGYPASASFPSGSMGAVLTSVPSGISAVASGVSAVGVLVDGLPVISQIITGPAIATDSNGGVSLSNSQAFDGVSLQSILELLVAAFVTGNATVVNNGNGTSTITRYKQDGSTAKYSVTFKPDGTVTGASILS